MKEWFGEGSSFNDLDRFAVDAARNASASSAKQMLHYGQSMRDTSFA